MQFSHRDPSQPNFHFIHTRDLIAITNHNITIAMSLSTISEQFCTYLHLFPSFGPFPLGINHLTAKTQPPSSTPST